MRANTLRTGDFWDELVDRDVETLLKGGAPANADLAMLEPFVTTFRSFGRQSPSDEFIELHATRSAVVARKAHALAVSQVGQHGRAGFMFRLRQRATALATTVLMIAGMTGAAWAADGAGPDDWYYGIDRALEAIGIGAGGAEERLLEAANGSGEGLTVTGRERASDRVLSAGNGNEQSLAVRDRVSAMLDLPAGEGSKGEAISSIAKTGVENAAVPISWAKLR